MPVGPVEIIVLSVLVLLFFGAPKIPKLARSLGQASREYRAAKEEGTEEPRAKRLPDRSA